MFSSSRLLPIQSDVLLSWQQTIELFFPKVCASCQAFGPAMLNSRALCPLCDQLVRLSALNLHESQLPGLQHLPVYSAGRYEHELGRCVLAFKDAGRTDLAPYLTSALARSLVALLEVACWDGKAPIYLVPLPSSRASVNRRGYAPAPFLARATLPLLKHEGGIKVLEALTHVSPWRKSTMPVAGQRYRAQKTLGVEERHRHMRGKLTLAKPALHWLGRSYHLAGAHCILVDDVLTTGASLTEGYRVLTGQGAKVLGAATIAYVPKRQTYSTG